MLFQIIVDIIRKVQLSKQALTIFMQGQISIILYGIFTYLIQTNNLDNLVYFILVVNFLYVANKINSQGVSLAIKNIFLGQIIHSLLYLEWLRYYPQASYLYFVPLYLSCISKVYIILASSKTKEKIDQGFIQEVVIFQAKTQVFILGYSFVSLLVGQGYRIMYQTIIYVLICKLKYSMHHKTQIAYRQLHFGIDNCLKRTKLRYFYQIVYRAITMIGKVYSSQKQFVY